MDFALAEALGPAATVNQDADANDTDGHRAANGEVEERRSLPRCRRVSGATHRRVPKGQHVRHHCASNESSLEAVSGRARCESSRGRCSQIPRAVPACCPVLPPQGPQVGHGAGLRLSPVTNA